MMLASAVPNASIAVLTQGVPRRLPVTDSAGDHVKREQQHDEAHVFAKHRMHERGNRDREP